MKPRLTLPPRDHASEAGLRIRQIGASVSAGLIAAVMGLGIVLSIAALIFTGPLEAYISNGAGLLLVGVGIMSVVFALFSSRPGMVRFSQDSPALVSALIVANLLAGMPAAQSDAAYSTVIALFALTTLASGVTFLILGYFRLDELVRYLPYPVIGGFLAGTGWLLVLGGIGVTAGGQPGISTLPILLQPAVLGQWLPALLFGAVMLVALQRTRHPIALPALFLPEAVRKRASERRRRKLCRAADAARTTCAPRPRHNPS